MYKWDQWEGEIENSKHFVDVLNAGSTQAAYIPFAIDGTICNAVVDGDVVGGSAFAVSGDK